MIIKHNFWINLYRSDKTGEIRPGTLTRSIQRSEELRKGCELQGHTFVRRILVCEEVND